MLREIDTYLCSIIMNALPSQILSDIYTSETIFWHEQFLSSKQNKSQPSLNFEFLDKLFYRKTL